MTVGKEREIDVLTSNAGKSDVPARVTVTAPSGKKKELPDKKIPDGYATFFTPTEVGTHKVEVTYNAASVPKSPFKVDVLPDSASKVKAWGPGLKGGHANSPAEFTIDARAATTPGELGVTIEGPKESKIDTKQNPDGTVGVTYYPTVPGDYNVNVTYGNQHIKDSPFKAKILPEEPSAKVKAYGPGLTGGEAGVEAKFTVDAKEVPKQPGKPEGKVDVKITGGPAPVTPKTTKKPDGTTDVSYTPTKPGDYTIGVTYDNKPIKDSPFKAKIVPAKQRPVADANVKAFGPGLEGGNALQPAKFTVDARKATTPGGIGVKVEGPKEAKIETKPNPDGTVGVTYHPTVPGDYTVDVTYADKPLKDSPYKVKIAPSSGVPQEEMIAPSKVAPASSAAPGTKENGVKAYGPGLKSGNADRPAVFTVDARNATYPGAIGVGIEGPTEAKIDTKQNPDGTVGVTYYPTTPGEYTVNVTYDNAPIKESPFKAKIRPGTGQQPAPTAKPDLSGVKTYGPGLNPDGKWTVHGKRDCVKPAMHGENCCATLFDRGFNEYGLHFIMFE